MPTKEQNKKNFKKWYSANADLHNTRYAEKKKEKYDEGKKKLTKEYLKRLVKTEGMTDQEIQSALAAKRRALVIKKLQKQGLKVVG